MIKRRLLRAILNSGVSSWKEFSYDEKKQAILEVTPYTYNVKYATITLSNVKIKSGSGSISVTTKGFFTDLGFAFKLDGQFGKLDVNKSGVSTFVPLDYQVSPVLILSKGNSLAEIESVSSYDFEGTLTPIIAAKFTSSAPFISMDFKG